jgi:hypothetical protein
MSVTIAFRSIWPEAAIRMARSKSTGS